MNSYLVLYFYFVQSSILHYCLLYILMIKPTLREENKVNVVVNKQNKIFVIYEILVVMVMLVGIQTTFMFPTFKLFHSNVVAMKLISN